MPRERVFWLVLASLILAGLAAGFFTGGPRTVPLALAPGAPAFAPQAATARSWREVRFERVAALAAGEGLLLGNPTLLRLDGQENLYVLDSGRSRVARFSRDGAPAGGYGPADLGNPTDVAVAAGGGVWVADPDRRRITVFSPAGAVARRIGLPAPPFRLGLASGDGGFVATLHRAGPGLFQRFSAAGEPGRAFGTFFPPELQSTLTADGWIVDAGPAGFVYPFRHAGLLAAFTWQGEPRYFRRTIDPLHLPAVHLDTAGGQTIGREEPLASLCAGVDGRDLYVLSAGAEGGRAVDVYDAANGDYRWSFRPPEADARCVLVTAGRLFSASGRGVTVWRRPS